MELPRVVPVSSEGFISVQDAATHLDRTERYLYKLIRERRLRAERKDRILKLPVSELMRLSEIFAGRKLIREEKERLIASGKGDAASRKVIFRKHRGSPRV